jgi:hypothetical protein
MCLKVKTKKTKCVKEMSESYTKSWVIKNHTVHTKIINNCKICFVSLKSEVSTKKFENEDI